MPFEESSLVPLIDIRDAGRFISPALLEPDKYNGKNFTCASAFSTPVEMVDVLTKVTGTKVHFQKLDLSFSVVKWDTEVLKKYGYYGLTGKDDLKWTLEQMTEKPRGWEEFVRDHQPWFGV